MLVESLQTSQIAIVLFQQDKAKSCQYSMKRLLQFYNIEQIMLETGKLER